MNYWAITIPGCEEGTYGVRGSAKMLQVRHRNIRASGRASGLAGGQEEREPNKEP